MAEPFAEFGVFHHFFPFALVVVNQRLHFILQACRYPQAVVHHHVAEVGHAAFHFVQPGGGACQGIGGFNVKHQEAVNIPDAGFVIQVLGQQQGMLRFGATVAAHVQVPAFFRSDNTKVFALRFGTFADATRNRRLYFVWRPQTAVAFFYPDGETNGVVQAKTAPG